MEAKSYLDAELRTLPMIETNGLLSQDGIVVRPLRDLTEMEACVTLQQAVWGYSDRDVLPARVFLVALRCNGQVLGAFDGRRSVGFAIALLSSHGQKMYLHSHMVGVHPEYQNRGVGRLLKLAQRSDALARGIDLIEWTFDPLQSRNAYFNLSRLGAIARTYIPNFYGNTSSPLHGGLPTDRLVAEWWLASPHVVNCIENRPTLRDRLNEITMPIDIVGRAQTDPAQAQQFQMSLRAQFQRSFAEGFAATGFEVRHDHVVYLMESYEDRIYCSARNPHALEVTV